MVENGKIKMEPDWTYKKHFSSILFVSALHLSTIGGPFDSNVGLHTVWAVRFLCNCIVCGQRAMIDVPMGMLPVQCSRDDDNERTNVRIM